MDVGPACQLRSPLVFQVGAEPHFPHLEQFPTLTECGSSEYGGGGESCV